ncbi:DM13 domain-containing protein [Microbacterium sp. KUDC0406]|uniref:DM13 domain-containing protein n=1 Tax=Microbacterium sp. KUDC0406 TaxID=2909588 RepID=UPI001F3785B1|nr:DM13 domain-containing protein [Microbacterium sp. KUDC0406]UJP09854.1 DM13 domain-containing protein [Microbacterium sp. KUDC0406]
MRRTPAIATALLALGLALAGCSSPGAMEKDSTPMSEESMAPSASADDMMMAKVSGKFEGLNGKAVSGDATVEDGKVVLSGFSSDEGPDLHVYLTNGTDEAAVGEGMLVDAVAFDQESQTFMIDDVDVSKYSYVVIHCDKAKAVFGAAKLS